MFTKKTITIIGGGNVAFHLMNVFEKSEKSEVKQLYNRSGFTSDFQRFSVNKINDISLLKPTDICIIAVKDDAISLISSTLPFSDTLVVHTSGNTDISAIDSKNRRGVFYPLQSFSKEISVDFSKIPICIETENEQDFELLTALAAEFTPKIYRMNGQQRKMLHISAVFTNNFTNYLIGVGQELCENNGIPSEILDSLRKETFEKLQMLSPTQAQTGPARRGDLQTLQNHLALLPNDKKELYKIITNSILTTYGKEKL